MFKEKVLTSVWVTYGIKIFHIPVLTALTVEDMNEQTGFDPDFDMLLVYGVLRQSFTGAAGSGYEERYQQLLYDYQTANSGWETYVVKERW